MSSILALDLGTHTGVAYGPAGSRPTLETWDMPAGGGKDVGPFMGAFIANMEHALEGVSLVIFEEPYVAVRENPHTKKPYLQLDQIRRAYGMCGIVEGMAHARGIQCAGVVTVTLKKDFTGSGRADKAAMMRMARLLGFEPKNDHEADALAAWVYALRITQPHLAHSYDEIFARGRL